MLRQSGLTERDPVDPAAFLSIVIPTFDRHHFLAEAIAAIERQTLDAGAFELIVVDNSSDRNAQRDFLAKLAVDCRCDYVVEEVSGANRARNVGIRLARGEVVAFLDDDAQPDPGWAEAIAARFAETPVVGVMGGPVVPIWPGERPAWLPPWADAFLSVLDHGPAARVLGASEHLVSANLAFRKAALQAVGGFPEHLGRRGTSLLSNDELSLRDAVVAGGSVAFYEPRMRVRHRVHADRLSQGWLRRRMAWQIVSDLIETDGDVAGEELPDREALRLLLGLQPVDRGLDALLDRLGDSAAVTRQMRAVRLLMRLLLAAPSRGPAG